jgi:hypothetical protein
VEAVVRTLLLTFVMLFACGPALAQPWVMNDSKHATEIGFFQDWFHRELEPSIYSDTRWSTMSVSLNYNATDWLNLGFEGGRSRYEAEDFQNAEYERYSVGGSVGVRVYRWNRWQLSAGARYQDTFDLDTSAHYFHKRVRTISGSVNVVGGLGMLGQSLALWAGPTIVDDLVQSFPLDSLDSIDSTSGFGLGAGAGVRIILGGWASVYGFASYVEEIQGGVGVCLHVGKGSL